MAEAQVKLNTESWADKALMLGNIEKFNIETAKQAKETLGTFCNQKSVASLLKTNKSQIPGIIAGLNSENTAAVSVGQGPKDVFSVKVKTVQGPQIITLVVDDRSTQLSRAIVKGGEEKIAEILTENKTKTGGEMTYQRLA